MQELEAFSAIGIKESFEVFFPLMFNLDDQHRYFRAKLSFFVGSIGTVSLHPFPSHQQL